MQNISLPYLLSAFLYAIVATADLRVNDIYGAIFWTAAFALFAVLSYRPALATHRGWRITMLTLCMFSVAVLFIRLVLKYTG